MPPTEFQLPAQLASIGRHLPQAPWSLALCTAINLARSYGGLDADFSFMEGRSLCIEVSDLGIQSSIRLDHGRFRVQRTKAECDVRFTAKASTYLALLRRTEDPDTLFFQRKLRIEGDTELGLHLKNLLDATEPPAWMLRLLP